MKKQMKRFASLLMVTGLCLSFVGCGSETLTDVAASVSEEAPAKPETTTEGENKTVLSETAKALLGEWTMVASQYDDYEISYASTYDSVGSIEFYTEDDRLRAFYFYESYESECQLDTKANLEKGTFSADGFTTDWYGSLPLRNTRQYLLKDEYTFAIHPDKPNLLVLKNVSVYDTQPDDDWDGTNTFYRYYIRKGAVDFEELAESMHYAETITVDNTLDLLNSIGSNRSILLKPGVYNVSQVSPEEIGNDWYVGYQDCPTYSYVYGCKLAAETPGTVTIVTEDPYSAPLSFEDSNDVTIDGLIMGHDVEPGLCSGAVLSLYDGSQFTIRNCSLFGSGAYAVDISGTYDVNIIDCDMYECTYGATYLGGASSITFENCHIHDNNGYNLFEIYNCYNIRFKNCIVENNSIPDGNLFRADESDVTFTDCKFKNNTYSNLGESGVELINCTF